MSPLWSSLAPPVRARQSYLVLDHSESYMIKNHEVALVDPTTILAFKCIELARENTDKPQSLSKQQCVG
jgi:hypothetical protein